MTQDELEKIHAEIVNLNAQTVKLSKETNWHVWAVMSGYSAVMAGLIIAVTTLVIKVFHL
jgi:hypothetical protein